MRFLAKCGVALALMPLSLMAQPKQMSDEQLQMLMQGAMQMQACFAKIDQNQLETLGKKAQEMETELRGLCTSGKRDQAQAQAIEYARDFAASPEVQQLKQCGEIAQAMLPQLLSSLEDVDADTDDVSTHVCDNL
ncbi:MAG TPA: hypothetical protein VIK82_04120 [Porticoccaceae bacterium]